MKQHKKIYLGLFFLAVLTGAFVVMESLRTPAVAVGRTITAEERPGQWKEIIAGSVNRKGITLIVDGKQVIQSGAPVIMNDNMNILIPDYLITETFNCAYGDYAHEKILLQKGNTQVQAQMSMDYIKIGEEFVQMGTPCMLDGDTMYIQSQIFSKGLGYEYNWDINENKLYLTDLKYASGALPFRYSYVDVDRVATIKNQGDLSICWATASVAAMETSLLPRENYFFSAEHMAYSNGNAATVTLGGEYTRAIAYLASWLGPVHNEEAFLEDGSLNPGAQALKHVQEVQLLESKNYESIKRAVFLYGGVQSSMYTSMTTSSGNSVYYNRKTASYCYIGTKKANHDVVIVGWDDNYPKENFNIELEGDGAFICMNSWGTDFGDNGIFYVSYYDSNIGKNNVVYTSIEDVDNYDNLYQSDLAGWVGQLGYDSETAYFANAYTARGNEMLRAVSFYATGKNTEYEIYFVDEFNGTESFARKTLVQKGNLANAGYYTIDLKEALPMEAGKKYAVVIRITTAGALHPIAVERRAGVGTQEVIIDDGEGYISLTGNSWEHVEESKNCNLCLKLFTDNQ